MHGCASGLKISLEVAKQKAKISSLTKDERIKKGRKHIDLHYTILRNDPGRNGRFIIQRNLFAEDPEEDF